MTSASWRDQNLVALDLEGSGAQDRDDEAILEIAVVPLASGRPDLGTAFSTLVNPGRKIRCGAWISPGLTNTVLASAPPIAEIEPRVAERLAGSVIVGHNIAVDWRLLHRRCPSIQPAGLVDTLRLAKHFCPNDRDRALAALVDRVGLTPDVDQLAAGSQTHRALWDAVAAALLLEALIANGYPDDPPLRRVIDVAGVPLDPTRGTLRLF